MVGVHNGAEAVQALPKDEGLQHRSASAPAPPAEEAAEPTSLRKDLPSVHHPAVSGALNVALMMSLFGFREKERSR